MSNKYLIIIFGVFILLFNISFLQASSLPGDWWGTATINEGYANGAEVEAYIDNSMVASAIVGAIQPNYYLIHVPGKLGDLIQFKINGRNTENELQGWVLGSHRLDLIVNVSIKEPEEPKPKSSHKNHFVIGTCESNWECTGWSECINHAVMTRSCQDTNNCAYSYNKPIEKTGCETTSILELQGIDQATDQSSISFKNLHEPKNLLETISWILTIGIIILLICIMFIRKR